MRTYPRAYGGFKVDGPIRAEVDGKPRLAAEQLASGPPSSLSRRSASCEVECTYSPDAPEDCWYMDSAYYGCNCSLAACTTAAGAEIEWRDTWEWETNVGADWDDSTVIRSYTVIPPAGVGFTWLRYSEEEHSEQVAGAGTLLTMTTRVEWVGVLRDDWPVDGSWEAYTVDGRHYSHFQAAEGWVDPACAWRTSQDFYSNSAEVEPVYMEFDGHTLDIYRPACGVDDATIAFLDGAAWGQVDDAWEWWGGTDADGDGLPEGGGADCDDADALVYPGAVDAWYDGVDANCDGANDYDSDADGYDSDEHGGDDCDDEDAAVHPGAGDSPGDGDDSDCDGEDPTRPDDPHIPNERHWSDCGTWRCTAYPQEGPYEVVSSVGGELDSCLSGGVWYTSGWTRIVVSALEPGLSFEFRLGIDEVLATGVWQTNTEGEVWWAMARTCRVPESGDASICSENGTQNCAMTTHLTLTHRP